MRLGGTRRGGMRHPQAQGDWSMYLCGAPVQNRNEERMASDISRQWFNKSTITSRDIHKLTVSALLTHFLPLAFFHD